MNRDDQLSEAATESTYFTAPTSRQGPRARSVNAARYRLRCRRNIGGVVGDWLSDPGRFAAGR
jgi:hypothetical protein